VAQRFTITETRQPEVPGCRVFLLQKKSLSQKGPGCGYAGVARSMKSAPAANPTAAVSGFPSGSGPGMDGMDGADFRGRELRGLTDAALASAAAAQDQAGREAFVEIVRRHQNAVCAVAWSVTGRAGLRDDIAQETFFKAWKQIATLRDPARLKAWLTRIAHDCAVDALRREKPHASLDDPAFSTHPDLSGPLMTASAAATAAMTISCGSAAPDKAAADAEDEALVWSALAALPENLRTPLVLFYREGQSMAAVAAALDLSEDAVRQRLSRGRQALRSAVEARVETVLGRVQPSALLIVTIASGIGLLTKHAASAAGIGSGLISAGGASAGSAAAGAGTGAGAAATGTLSSAAAGTGSGAVVVTTATTAAASGAAGISTFSTIMTASSWLAAGLSLAAFLPVGWQVGGLASLADSGKSSAATSPAGKTGAAAAAGDPFAAFAGSELLAVWRRLHAEHGSDAAAMPVIYDIIQSGPDQFRRSALGIALLSEWAGLDPEGAFQVVWSEKRNTDHASLLMREWLKRDPDKAADHLLANLQGAEALGAGLAKDIAERAPQRFIALLAAMPEPDSGVDYSPFLNRAFRSFADRDPKAALDSLPLLKASVLKEARSSVGKAMAKRDPDAALKWSETVDSKDDRAIIANYVSWLQAQAVAKGDPVAFLSGLDPSPESQPQAVEALNAIAAKDLSAALDLWREDPSKFGPRGVAVFRNRLPEEFRQDPQGTLDVLGAQPEETRSLLARELSAGQFSPENAGLLWDWATVLPDSGAAGEVCANLLKSGFRDNPGEALRRLQSLPPAVQSAAMSGAPEFVSGLESGAFESLLKNVDSAVRPRLIAAGFLNAANVPVPDVALWRQRLDELPSDAQRDAAAKFAGNLVDVDPQLAVSFAASLPDGPVKDRACTDLMGSWMMTDAWQASLWADQLPPGSSARDAASVVLVRRLLNTDVDDALTWAASIGNTDLRLRVLTEFVNKDPAWHLEPNAGTDVLNNPLLKPEDREALLKARAQITQTPAAN
jgi:RNA polymerase sigma factor (sigma-70 family)